MKKDFMFLWLKSPLTCFSCFEIGISVIVLSLLSVISVILCIGSCYIVLSSAWTCIFSVSRLSKLKSNCDDFQPTNIDFHKNYTCHNFLWIKLVYWTICADISLTDIAKVSLRHIGISNRSIQSLIRTTNNIWGKAYKTLPNWKGRGGGADLRNYNLLTIFMENALEISIKKRGEGGYKQNSPLI